MNSDTKGTKTCTRTITTTTTITIGITRVITDEDITATTTDAAGMTTHTTSPIGGNVVAFRK